jgi:hypothetical protein
MSPSSVDDVDPESSTSPAPAPRLDPEDDTQNIDQYWLTLRRRCELCKQRKVRILGISASVDRAGTVSDQLAIPSL